MHKSIILSSSNLDLISLLGQAVQFLGVSWIVKGVDLTNHWVTLKNEQGILSTHRANIEVTK